MELNEKVADFTLQTDEDKTVKSLGLCRQAGDPVLLSKGRYPRLHH